MSVARGRYERFVRDGLGEGRREDFYQGREDTRVIGDDRFVEQVLGQANEKSEWQLSLDHLVTTVCRVHKIEEAQLRRLSRNRRAAEVRAVIGYLAIETQCGTLTEVAHRFGRDVATASKGVHRFEQRARVSEATRERIARLLYSKASQVTLLLLD